MDCVQISLLVVQTLTLIILACSVYLVKHQIAELKTQITKTHEWNRRKAAQDLVDHMYRIGYYEKTARLNKIECLDKKIRVDIDDPKQTYAIIKDNLGEKKIDEVSEFLRPLLAFCEEIALGIRHKIYDADIAYDYFGFLVPQLYNWAEGFIQEVRKDTQDDTIYIEMEQLSEEWCKRSEEEKAKARKTKQSNSKEPL